MKRRFSAQENPRADSTALRAARESVVLLKNEKNLLPLSRKKSACIIGDIVMGNGEENFAAEFSKFLGKEGYNIIGTQRGYDLSKERSEQLLEAAVNFAYHADTAIVFLGLGKTRERNIESTARL